MAKIVQTERSTKVENKVFSFLLPRCSLSYSKIVQTERSTKVGNKVFSFLLPRCRLSYVKIHIFHVIHCRFMDIQQILCQKFPPPARNAPFGIQSDTKFRKIVLLCCQNALLADTRIFRKGGNRRNWELKMTLFQPQRIFFEGKQCLFRGKTLLFPSPDIHSELGKHALQAGKTSTLARQSATLAR